MTFSRKCRHFYLQWELKLTFQLESAPLTLLEPIITQYSSLGWLTEGLSMEETASIWIPTRPWTHPHNQRQGSWSTEQFVPIPGLLRLRVCLQVLCFVARLYSTLPQVVVIVVEWMMMVVCPSSHSRNPFIWLGGTHSLRCFTYTGILLRQTYSSPTKQASKYHINPDQLLLLPSPIQWTNDIDFDWGFLACFCSHLPHHRRY